MIRQIVRLALVPTLAAIALVVPATPAAAQIDARMLRQPDVSATQIAFVYAGDIWVVPKQGGVAVRLSSPRGEEQLPALLARRQDARLLAPTTTATPTSTPSPAQGGEPVRLT